MYNSSYSSILEIVEFLKIHARFLKLFDCECTLAFFYQPRIGFCKNVLKWGIRLNGEMMWFSANSKQNSIKMIWISLIHLISSKNICIF